MVIAHHLVWTVYGTWLPNDPRGSGSKSIATLRLLELGELHFGRKRKQPTRAEVHEFYSLAEPQLCYPVVRFHPKQLAVIGNILGRAVSQLGYTCYACAIMPDHVHLVIRKHKHLAEEMIENLQTETAPQIVNELLLEADHPVWTIGGWKSFLNTPAHVRTAIRYVENNPTEARLPPQHWGFVTPYDNWPFHRRTKSTNK